MLRRDAVEALVGRKFDAASPVTRSLDVTVALLNSRAPGGTDTNRIREVDQAMHDHGVEPNDRIPPARMSPSGRSVLRLRGLSLVWARGRVRLGDVSGSVRQARIPAGSARPASRPEGRGRRRESLVPEGIRASQPRSPASRLNPQDPSLETRVGRSGVRSLPPVGPFRSRLAPRASSLDAGLAVVAEISRHPLVSNESQTSGLSLRNSVLRCEAPPRSSPRSDQRWEARRRGAPDGRASECPRPPPVRSAHRASRTPRAPP